METPTAQSNQLINSGSASLRSPETPTATTPTSPIVSLTASSVSTATASSYASTNSSSLPGTTGIGLSTSSPASTVTTSSPESTAGVGTGVTSSISTSSLESASGNSTLTFSQFFTSSGTGTGASQIATSSSSPVISHGSHSGLSTGAKAGIAVGAVIGAVILGVVAFFLLRKKSILSRAQHYQPPYEKETYTGPQHPNVHGTSKAIPVVANAYSQSAQDARETLTMLPQQADDATVSSRFATLYDQIELHIENFYLDASPVIPPAIEGALSQYDTPFVSPLASTLEESPRVTTILKHILAYEITATAVAPSARSRKRSFLPSDLQDALNAVQSEQQAPEYRGSSPTPAYIHLKTLAVQYHALSPSIPHRVLAASESAASESALRFTDIFSLWANPKFDQQRRAKHLTEVMNSAVTFSIWLLSHPEQFEIRWGDVGEQRGDRNRTRQLVTVPALIKITGQGGGRLQWEGPVLNEPVWRNV